MTRLFYKPVCSTCGGDDIKVDAWAIFNPQRRSSSSSAQASLHGARPATVRLQSSQSHSKAAN